MGRVKLIDTRGHERLAKSRIVSGYERFRNWAVHRLVAFHFISNPHGYKFVDHINGDNFDNSARNLRWVKSFKDNASNINSKKRMSIVKRNPGVFFVGAKLHGNTNAADGS